MSETDSIESASRRLALALDALDAAVERRVAADRKEASLAAQIHALDSDRARLVGELDVAMARSRVLENANREVAERVARTIDNIREALASEDEGVAAVGPASPEVASGPAAADDDDE